MSKVWLPTSMSVHLHPHLNLLGSLDVSPERELEHQDLPVQILERQDIRYATRLVGRFIDRMERRDGKI